MMVMVGGYNFINHHPGKYRLRNGCLSKGERGLSEWSKALAGHVSVAHSGKEQTDCAGCKELRARVKESS